MNLVLGLNLYEMYFLSCMDCRTKRSGLVQFQRGEKGKGGEVATTTAYVYPHHPHHLPLSHPPPTIFSYSFLL